VHRLLLLLVVLLTACVDTGVAPDVVDGTLSLQGWTPGQAAPLSGRWRLQRGLVRPPIPLDDTVLVQVPGRWDEGVDAPMDGPFGAATYELVITDLPTTPEVALEVEVAGAVEAWVDGVQVASRGRVDPDERSSTWLPVLIPLPRGAEQARVRLLVANDAVRLAGVTAAVAGSTQALETRVQRRLIGDVVNVSVLGTFGVVFLVIGLRRQSEPAYAIFALLCLDLALRDFVGGHGDMRAILAPWLPWELAVRIEYTTLPLGTIFGWGAIVHVTRMLRRSPVTWTIVGASAVLAVLTLILPITTMRYVLPTSQVLMLGTGLGVFVLLIAAWLRGEQRVLLHLAALCVFVVAMVHDVLISFGLFETGIRLGTLGFLSVMAVFGLLLVGDFVRSFLLNEQLNAQLERSHAQLQRTHQAVLRFVPDTFLRLLGKESIVEVERGDHAQAEMEILFCDLRSFTTLIESLGPDRAFPFINRYLRYMEPAITGNGGFINQYLGDCIMALFPGDSADAAVRAAVQMTVALRSFNEHEPEGPVRFGIGIASGPLMLGTIGGQERLDGGVIGDSVNHASRIEGMTKLYGTVLIIDQSTALRLSGEEVVTLRELDRVVAKGRRKASAIYEVLDALPEEDRRARSRTLPIWEEALTAYRAGELVRAKGLFQQCLAEHDRDEAARLFVRRCEVLQREGLPRNWDGTTSLARK